MRNTRRANQVRTMQAVLPAARPLDRERNDRNGQPGHLRSAHNRQRRRWICCPPRLSTFTSHPDTGACSMKRRSARKRPVTTRQHGVPVSANLTSPRDMVRFIVLIPHAQAEGSSPHRARDDRPRCGDLPRFGAITGAVRASTHATESEWRPSRSATGTPSTATRDTGHTSPTSSPPGWWAAHACKHIAGGAEVANRYGRQLYAWQKASARQRALGLPCALCGRPIDYSAEARTPWAFTADHIVPVSRGGNLLSPTNIRSAHNRCNTSRGNREEAVRRSRAW